MNRVRLFLAEKSRYVENLSNYVIKAHNEQDVRYLLYFLYNNLEIPIETWWVHVGESHMPISDEMEEWLTRNTKLWDINELTGEFQILSHDFVPEVVCEIDQ